jgi:hypothetical protein
MVQVVRAWPNHPPGGRPHVHDDWPRVAVDNFDYRGLIALGDNVINLDWDVAVDLDDLRSFANHAAENPDRPLWGPCKLWGEPIPRWCAQTIAPDGSCVNWVTEVDTYCHLFGFGFTYLPHSLMVQYVAENPGTIMSDVTFATWLYYTQGRGEVKIDWSVRGIHIHYDCKL